MSGLLFLENDDFVLAKGTKGNILCTSIPGFSLILFYSTQCPHCQKLVPIFKKLPGSIGGCQFGMLNVSTNKNCVRLSKDTIAPITYVPYIVLYVGGKPFMKYQGPHDLNEIKRFVIEVSKKIETKQKFSQIPNKKDTKKHPHTDYGNNYIGCPLYGCDDDIYMEYEEAYSGK